jgi:hypothetical protein
MMSSPVQGACYGIEIGRWWGCRQVRYDSRVPSRDGQYRLTPLLPFGVRSYEGH